MKLITSIKNSILNNTKSATLFVISASMALVGILVYSANINGDAYVHTTIIDIIYKSGNLATNYYKLLKTEPLTFAPIQYPETIHVGLTPLYGLFGENGLRFFSVLIAGTITLVTISMLKPYINYRLIVLTSFFVVISNIRRLVMFPLIEPFILVFTLIPIFLYVKYLNSKDVKHLILGLFSIFFLSSLKLQGLYLAGMLLSLIMVLELIRWNGIRHYVIIFLCSFGFLMLNIAPMSNQLERVGSLGFGTGILRLPNWIPYHELIEDTFFTSNYIQSDDEIKLEDEIITYRLSNQTIKDTVLRIVKYPLTIDKNLEIYPIITLSSGILLLVGSLVLMLKAFKLSLLIGGLMILEFVIIMEKNQTIYQYHPFASYGIGLLFTLGFFYIINKFINKKQLFPLLIATMLLIVFFINFSLNITTYSLYGQEGRNTSEQISMYKEMGKYISEEIPQDQIILNSNIMLGRYSQHNYIWNGAEAYYFFKADTEEEAIQYLNKHNISYIMLNTEQLLRYGVYDFVPQAAITSNISNLQYLTVLHRVYSLNGHSLILLKRNENSYNI